MNWDDAKLFLTIARAGSVRRAAGPMDLHHSTVLRRLDALERQLSVRLFDRGRSYALTAAGEALRMHAEAAEAALAAAQAALSEGDARIAGAVRIAAPEPIASRLLIPALPAWIARYPDLAVSVVAAPDGAATPAAEADVRVRIAAGPRGDELDHAVGPCAEAAYAAEHWAATLGDVSDPSLCRLIGRLDRDGPAGSEGAAYPAWAEAHGLGGARVRHAVDGLAAAAAAAQAGLGVAALPCLLGDALPGLVRVREPWPIGEARVCAPADRRASARVQAAQRFCRETLEAARPALAGRPAG